METSEAIYLRQNKTICILEAAGDDKIVELATSAVSC